MLHTPCSSRVLCPSPPPTTTAAGLSFFPRSFNFLSLFAADGVCIGRARRRAVPRAGCGVAVRFGSIWRARRRLFAISGHFVTCFPPPSSTTSSKLSTMDDGTSSASAAARTRTTRTTRFVDVQSANSCLQPTVDVLRVSLSHFPLTLSPVG